MEAFGGFNGASVFLYILFFIVLLFTYVPLTVLLGGWDDYDLFTFGKAIKLSGPSKPLFKPLFKLILVCRKAAVKMNTHARFPMDHEIAHKQILELMEIKKLELERSQI